MDQIAFKMFLSPGQADEYKRRHDAIWPQLVDALHAAGIRDYSIFLDEETHVLFAVLRRTDDHHIDQLPQQEVMRRWWRYMGDIMQTNEDGSPRQRGLRAMFHMA